MKNVNVKVTVLENGSVEVVGLNKDGSVSAVNYVVTETVGVKEFAKAMMTAGASKQLESMKGAERSEAPPAKESKAPATKPEKESADMKNKKGYESILTKGKMFRNFKGYKHEDIFHAIKFEIAGKGECVVGFAKDRNVFMEHYNGEAKEVSRRDVVKRLAKYEGKDAAKLVKMINNLKPVTMAAGKCSCCDKEVVARVREYSVRKYGVILCRDCQSDFTGEVGAERSEAQIEVTTDEGNTQEVVTDPTELFDASELIVNAGIYAEGQSVE